MAASAIFHEALAPERLHQRFDLCRDVFPRDVVLLQQLFFDLGPGPTVGEELPEARAGGTEREDAVRPQMYEHDLVAHPARDDVGARRWKNPGRAGIGIRRSAAHTPILLDFRGRRA